MISFFTGVLLTFIIGCGIWYKCPDFLMKMLGHRTDKKLREDNRKFKEKNAKLTESLLKSKANNEKLLAEIKQVKANNSQLNENNATVRNNFNKFKKAYDDLVPKYNNLLAESKKSAETINNLKEVEKQLKAKIHLLESKLQEKQKPILESIVQKPVLLDEKPVSVQDNVKFAKYPIGDVFRKLYDTPEDCFFRIKLLSTDEAEFSFFGDPVEAIANYDAVITSACYVESKVDRAEEIVSIHPGRIRYNGTSWTIETKARIRLI